MTDLVQPLTKRMGWAYESTEGTSPITSGAVPYYEFGKTVKSRGDFPYKEYNLFAYYAGSRDPAIRASHYLPKGAVAIAPTNGVELYNIFGGSATESGIHTITGIDNGSLPTRTLRFQSENSSNAVRGEMVGMKSKALNFELQNANQGMKFPLMFGIGMQGTNIQAASHDADYAPVFPDSEENMYYVDANFELTWDYGGDDIDISAEIADFQYIVDTTNRFQPLLAQLNPNTILDGNRAHILNMRLFAGGDTSILDDHNAQTRSSSGKALRCKIYNSPSNYIQLDISGIFTQSVKLNEGNDQQNEPDFYNVAALATSCIPKVKDGLTASTFYGE